MNHAASEASLDSEFAHKPTLTCSCALLPGAGLLKRIGVLNANPERIIVRLLCSCSTEEENGGVFEDDKIICCYSCTVVCIFLLGSSVSLPCSP